MEKLKKCVVNTTTGLDAKKETRAPNGLLCSMARACNVTCIILMHLCFFSEDGGPLDGLDENSADDAQHGETTVRALHVRLKIQLRLFERHGEQNVMKESARLSEVG